MLMNYVFTQDSFLESVLLKTEPLKAQQTSMFYSYIVLIYINETIYLLGNLSFFKIQVNSFMGRMAHLEPALSKNACCGEGPGATPSVLRHFLSLISSSLIGI